MLAAVQKHHTDTSAWCLILPASQCSVCLYFTIEDVDVHRGPVVELEAQTQVL